MTIERSRSLQDFDPSQASVPGTLWGLPFDVQSARLVILPVPWEVTVSYGTGAAKAPRAILAASAQVDLYDSMRPDAWKQGIALAPVPEEIEALGESLRPLAAKAIESLSRDGAPDEECVRRVNAGSETMVDWVKRSADEYLQAGKLVAVLGGDHSVPLGLMRALAERHRGYGVLHFDAHCDLRNAYEGFVHSHASIMHNALGLDAVKRLVQVGVRDLCQEEIDTVAGSGGRIRLFDYRTLSRRRFSGESWSAIVEEIVSELPEEVYVSFDVDGLDPALCPGTGTPVPGGLAYEEALYLVERTVDTGRSIIGFDLCEVSPGANPSDPWDANVGARLLYRLSAAAMPRGRT
jgi:agmatinase